MRFAFSVLFHYRLPILTIMLLPVDISAGTVEHTVEVITLVPRDSAIGLRYPFGNSDSGLLNFEAGRFAAR
jgi:hypothetical protein